MSAQYPGGVSILEIQKSKLFEKDEQNAWKNAFPFRFVCGYHWLIWKGKLTSGCLQNSGGKQWGHYFRWSGGVKVTCYAGDFIQANVLSERVVKVSTEQPGFTFRLELVWAFVNFHALTVHIRNTNVDWSIFIKCVSRTCTQPETVLVRNGDRTILSRNWAVIKGDTGTEGPVIIVVISGCLLYTSTSPRDA